MTTPNLGHQDPRPIEAQISLDENGTMGRNAEKDFMNQFPTVAVTLRSRPSLAVPINATPQFPLPSVRSSSHRFLSLNFRSLKPENEIMRFALVIVLFIVSLVSIGGCMNAKREYDDYIASQNGLAGFVEGFADGYTGTTSFGEGAQFHAAELAENENRSFRWACFWTVFAAIVAFSGKSIR